MNSLVKFEGRIEALEIHNGVLSALVNSGDNLIKSSAISSAIAGSVSLGAQTVFLATQSRLDIQTVVMKISEKICVGQFHRALFEENEYVICVAKKSENNLYELYSVLSPKTGLLHMQVGMGASVKKHDASAMRGGRVMFFISSISLLLLIIFGRGVTLINIFVWAIASILFYIILFFIIKNASRSLKHLSEKSEKIFEIYGFQNPENIYLLTARHLDENAKLILESVYEYRKAIDFDPYPESYLQDK